MVNAAKLACLTVVWVTANVMMLVAELAGHPDAKAYSNFANFMTVALASGWMLTPRGDR